MIKKFRFLALMLLFTCHLNGQNLASSLYEIDYFPKEMQFAVDFINKTCDEVLVYNYTPSSFELRGKQAIMVKLPLKDKFSISIENDANEIVPFSKNIYYEHYFRLARMLPNFEIEEDLFSLPSIFNLAVLYFDANYYDILPELTKMRKDLRTYDDYFDEQLIYFAELAEDFGIDPTIYKGFKENVDIETLIIREIDQLLVDTLLDHLSDNEIDTLLDTFFRRQIFEKFTTEKTLQTLDYIFNREDVVGIIEAEVLQPNVKLTNLNNVFLNLPSKQMVVISDPSNRVEIKTIEISVNFKLMQLTIDFHTQNVVEVKLPKATFSGGKVKQKTIKTKLVRMEIAAKNKLLKVKDTNAKSDFYSVSLN